MPRQAAVTAENNFKNGLITESTGINFPENAVTETYNCIYEFDGSVSRRKGFDYETNAVFKTINRTNLAISNYLWRNVAGDGNTTLVVKQVGPTIYFYKTASGVFSQGAVTGTVTLTPVSGAPAPDQVEAQYSDGNGLLFITHPYCEPMYVSYDTTTDTPTATNITIQIRDFEGDILEPYTVTERHAAANLAAVDHHHLYNLYNQGWSTTNLTTWIAAQSTSPAIADIMWRFVTSTGAFDASATTVNNVTTTTGNTPAPKGHFVLTLANQDRSTASGVTGVTPTTTSYWRPSTSAFFAGRVFYSGIQYTGFNSKIYFTRIVQNVNQYGNCYQVNDPTDKTLFDLLPDDGGVISIPEAGTIYKLISVPGGLAVFAANGIWFVTGSSGIGFTAEDYSVQKIALIQTISASSFVNVGGLPAWWNAEGIYMMDVASDGNAMLPTVKSLTWPTIKTFYDDIPLNSKKRARGFFNYIDGHVYWLYKSEDTIQTTQAYEFDRVLNFNARTNAFYPWSIAGNVNVHGLVIFDSVSGEVTSNNVIDGSGNSVKDNLTDLNQVVAFSTSGAQTTLVPKFIVSYPDSGTYKFTFAEAESDTYKDWFQYDSTGTDYTSYFIAGYKLRGGGIRRFQSNWLRVFNQIEEEVSYYFQAIWDFATSASTGRWSDRQYVNTVESNFSNVARRFKVRGRGFVLQFKIESQDGKPFRILGWAGFDNVNQIP